MFQTKAEMKTTFLGSPKGRTPSVVIDYDNLNPDYTVWSLQQW
jgi:hypothetical protein